jgi:hypothetical protein
MRNKLTKQELYLFLQQETATLYQRAYRLAEQIARDEQDAFRFERRDIEPDFLSNLEWDTPRRSHRWRRSRDVIALNGSCLHGHKLLRVQTHETTLS